ncbi:MAG: hypothetical protein ACFFDF_05995 [Candidatus Odinarchaeota archaeon]
MSAQAAILSFVAVKSEIGRVFEIAKTDVENKISKNPIDEIVVKLVTNFFLFILINSFF